MRLIWRSWTDRHTNEMAANTEIAEAIAVTEHRAGICHQRAYFTEMVERIARHASSLLIMSACFMFGTMVTGDSQAKPLQ